MFDVSGYSEIGMRDANSIRVCLHGSNWLKVVVGEGSKGSGSRAR